jgi:hypothetical protein
MTIAQKVEKKLVFEVKEERIKMKQKEIEELGYIKNVKSWINRNPSEPDLGFETPLDDRGK